MDEKCKQNLSFWAFLQECGGLIKRIKNPLSSSPAIRGIINCVLWAICVGPLAVAFLHSPINLIGFPIIAFGFILMLYGFWKEEKISGADC